MIRKAGINDIEGVLEVIKDAKDLFKSRNSTQWQDTDGYPNYQTFLEDIKNDFLYVSEVDGKIVGVVALARIKEDAYDKIYEGAWLNNDEYYVIHRLAVKKEYYGKGIAKELLKYMDEETKKAGVHNIKVDTIIENVTMNNLLLKSGYVKCGIILLNRVNVLVKERIAYQKVLD